MTRVLITGFAPFGGERVNPSWQAASLVAAEPPAGLAVTAAELPCVFGESLDALRDAIRADNPDLVLCLGQAGGRPGVTVERVGINVDDARIPDNAGGQPIDEPVVPDGPAAYFSCSYRMRAATRHSVTRSVMLQDMRSPASWASG